MPEIRTHRFVEPTGEAHEFTLDELEEAIHLIWKNSVAKLPYQLVDEFDGAIVLRFARVLPGEIFDDVFLGEVDRMDVIAVAIVAYFEKTEWTLCWAMPIWLHDGPGELFYLGSDGIRITAEDMRTIV